MIPTQICSKCHEDFMNCKCEQFYPNIIDPESYELSKTRIKHGDTSWEGFLSHDTYVCSFCRQSRNCHVAPKLDATICTECIIEFFWKLNLAPRLFTIQELQAIYKLVEHMYIPYENQEAHNVINKIMKILKENDMDRTNSNKS